MMNTRLSDVTSPGRFYCLDICCDSDAAIQLKRLGVCQGRSVEVLQPGDPMVLRVVGARIGVSRRLARCVLVQAEDARTVREIVPPAAGFEVASPMSAASRFNEAEAVGHV
ncbi:MAG: FeoA family protein [Planctomycetaceae bacterium]